MSKFAGLILLFHFDLLYNIHSLWSSFLSSFSRIQ